MSGPQDIMSDRQKVNILLVDDQPAKLLSYEVILRELGENLLKAPSAQSAFEHLLKSDIAVILADVCMPDLDGFELARMIREHPRFQKTAIIFVSAVLLTDLDFLQGYRYGAVDYLSVPVIPEILRAKVKVFVELYRKTQQLEHMNHELEQRVAERTAALEASAAALRKSEERLRLAFDAAQMGWWDYDIVADQVTWSPSLVRIMGFAPESFGATLEGALTHVHPEDREQFITLVRDGMAEDRSRSCELRFIRPDGSVRWSLAAGQVIRDAAREPIRFAGVDLDITQRKEAEERQTMLVRELDHRARNLLAVVQSVLHLSRASTTPEFIAAVDGRIRALSRTHTMLSETRWRGVELGRIVEEEIAPFATGQSKQIAAEGPAVSLPPPTAQSLALALHELVTNAVKHGALSVPEGRLSLGWEVEPNALSALGRNGRAGHPGAHPAGLWHQGDSRRDRAAAGRARGLRMAWGGSALHIDHSAQADRQDRPVRGGSRWARTAGDDGAAIPIHRRQPHPGGRRRTPRGRDAGKSADRSGICSDRSHRYCCPGPAVRADGFHRRRHPRPERRGRAGLSRGGCVDGPRHSLRLPDRLSQ
jgi:PAS domain S-box-containing protein